MKMEIGQLFLGGNARIAINVGGGRAQSKKTKKIKKKKMNMMSDSFCQKRKRLIHVLIFILGISALLNIGAFAAWGILWIVRQ